jgi:Spy/CpxP family protein refolding chaperone
MRIAVLVMLVMTALGGAADAQPRGRGGATPEERREAIKNRIRGLRAQTLTDELKLDNTALGKVLPILSKWDDVTDKLMRDRVDIQKRLAASDAVKDPKVLDRLVDDTIANQKQFWDLETQRLAELRKVLTPAQAAKLIVVLPTFERRIQNQLRKATLRAQGRGGPPVGSDVDDEDDDEPHPRRR